MADENIEQIALEQRATDPRLEVQTPVAEPVTAEDPATTEVTTEDPPTTEQVTEQPKPAKKTAEEVLKGRVGHLTKTLSTKDQELAAERARADAAKARADAAEALLASSQRSGDAPSTTDVQPTVAPPIVPTYTQAEFEAAVAARAEEQEFNRKADDMYNSGASKYNDWKDAVDTLVVSGFMNKDLLDAAMVVEDGTAVIHYLGTNLDEAERINALPPARKAVEMAKLSTVLNTPKSVPVSSAPAPIKPVSGSPSPQLDLQRIADGDDMTSWAVARAKQGSRWAQGRR